eukprot:COSAG02_NODE_4410_length_5388_cov_2.471167_2_plen_128_part_00
MILTAEEAAAAAEAEVVEMTWDESTRQYRDERGEIVTKHNSRLSGHRNAQKLVDMTVSGSSVAVSRSMLTAIRRQLSLRACCRMQWAQNSAICLEHPFRMPLTTPSERIYKAWRFVRPSEAERRAGR